MYNVTQTIIFFILLYASVSGAAYSASKHASKEASYFGIWTPKRFQDCKASIGTSEELGESGNIIVKHDYYERGDAAPCKEAKTLIHDNKLIISASCFGEEFVSGQRKIGYQPVNLKIILIATNEIDIDGVRYIRCKKGMK